MFKTNKKVFFIIAGVVLFLAIATTVVVVLANNKAKKDAIVTVEDAGVLKNQAIDAIKNKDNETAKELLTDALEAYERNSDGKSKSVEHVDAEAMLCILDKTKCPEVTPEPTTETTTETEPVVEPAPDPTI